MEGHEDRPRLIDRCGDACGSSRSCAVLCAAGSARVAAAHVRIAIGGQTQMVYLPTTLAQELGFYRDEGLDVELQDFRGRREGAAGARRRQRRRRLRLLRSHDPDGGRTAASSWRSSRCCAIPGLVLATSPQAASDGDDDRRPEGPDRRRDERRVVVAHVSDVSADAASGAGRRRSASPPSARGATAIAAIERGRVDCRLDGRPVVHAGHATQSRRPRAGRSCATSAGTKEAFGTDTYPGAVLYSDGDWLRANRDTAARLARAIVRTLELDAHALGAGDRGEDAEGAARRGRRAVSSRR